MLACLIIALGGGLAQAQSFPRMLEDIKVLAGDGRETIQFQFSRPYEGEPLEEYAKGSFSLNFSSTGTNPPVRNLRVGDSKFIREIKIVQNKFSTTARFTLADPKASVKGLLEFSRDGNLLRVTRIPSVGAAGGGREQARELLVEMTDKIAGKGAAGTQPGGTGSGDVAPLAKTEDAAGAPLGNFPGMGWLPVVIMALSLTAIVGALYLTLFLYNRFIAGRLGRTGGSQSIRQVASFHIGPKQRIVILDINGELLACGVTPTQISFLTRLDGGGRGAKRTAPPRPLKPAPKAQEKPRDAAQAATATATARAKPNTQADPVQQFAEALKEKVGSLKRLK